MTHGIKSFNPLRLTISDLSDEASWKDWKRQNETPAMSRQRSKQAEKGVRRRGGYNRIGEGTCRNLRKRKG